MLINLYKISKKENSTKLPTGLTPFQTSVILKDNTDILHPVFELTDSSFNADYNYISLTWYGATRYYFVRKIEYVTNSIIDMYCDIDVLATWKSVISSSSQYIERTSDRTKYTGLSPLLNDVAIPSIVGCVVREFDEWDIFDKIDGYYILGLNAMGITNPITRRGSVSYVAMSKADLTTLINQLFGLTASFDDLAPIQYIVSCVYIPFTFHAADFHLEVDNNINLGSQNYQINLTYRSILDSSLMNSNGIIIKKHDFSIPNHYQYNSHGLYANYEPYSKCHIVGGPFGDFDIPLSTLVRNLRMELIVDHTDGTSILEICNQYTIPGFSKIVYMRIASQVGVPIALAQSVTQTTADKYKVYSAIASSIGSALTLNVGASIQNMGSAIMSAHEGNIPKVSTNGSNGSIASLNSIRVLYYENDILDSDDIHVGKPIYKTLTISSIASGSFIKVRNPLIEIDGLMEEEEMIQTYMENGFYYE